LIFTVPGSFDKDIGWPAGCYNNLDRAGVTILEIERCFTGSTTVFGPEAEGVRIRREVIDLESVVGLRDGEVGRIDDHNHGVHLGVEVAQDVDNAGFVKADAA